MLHSPIELTRAYFLEQGETLWRESVGLDEIQRWGSFSRVVSCERDGRMEILAIGNEWDFGSAWRAIGVIYRSIDSAASFERVAVVDGIRSIWTDGKENVLIAYYDTLATLSSNGTVDFVSVLPQRPNVRQAIIAGQDLWHLMFAITGSDSTYFYISDDAGKTWEGRTAVGFGPFEQRSFCQTAGDYSTWLFGGMETYRSTDDGYSWSSINNWGAYYADPLNKLHADIPSLSSLLTSKSESLTFICTDGGIYLSNDDGKTVKNISLRNLNVSQYYSSYTSRDNVDVVSVGSQDQGFQRSTVDTVQSAREFQQLISGDYSSLVSGDEGHSLFTVYPGFVMYIPDAELGWGAIGKDFVHRGQMWLPPLAVNKNFPKQTLLGGGTNSVGAYVYRYTAVGSYLVVDSIPFDFGEAEADVRISAIAVSNADPRYQYVVTTRSVVWASSDEGITWNKFERPQGLDGHYFSGNAIAIDPNNARRIYLGGSGYSASGVYVSDDGGQSFNPLNGLPPSLVLSLAVTDNGRMIGAATDAGAFVYDTATHIWTDITELGAPDQTYWHVDWVAPLRLFRFSTYGRGLWDFTPSFPTSVGDVSSSKTQLSMYGVLKGLVPALKVENSFPTKASCIFYDVEGRRIFSIEYFLISGTQFLEIPSEARSATMAVLILEDGSVAAAVIPAAR